MTANINLSFYFFPRLESESRFGEKNENEMK